MHRSIFAVALLTATACGIATANAVAHSTPQPSTTRLTLPAVCHYNGDLPDRACTPGAVDARVTQANIQSTICVKGYTATVRPPVTYTDPLKRQLLARYGDSQATTTYELDHLIPLELGGEPRSPSNLWPQLYPAAHHKDLVENAARATTCSGRITLAQAQQAIAADWTALARELGV